MLHSIFKIRICLFFCQLGLNQCFEKSTYSPNSSFWAAGWGLLLALRSEGTATPPPLGDSRAGGRISPKPGRPYGLIVRLPSRGGAQSPPGCLSRGAACLREGCRRRGFPVSGVVPGPGQARGWAGREVVGLQCPSSPTFA